MTIGLSTAAVHPRVSCGLYQGIGAFDLAGEQNVLTMPFSYTLMQSINQKALL